MDCDFSRISDGAADISAIIGSMGPPAKDFAVFRAADAVESIEESASGMLRAVVAVDEKLKELSGGLDKEREDRKVADAVTMNYTKKRDNVNLLLAILGLALAAAALVVSLLK